MEFFFLLKTFKVLFIKVLRSSLGAFYHLAVWTHAKLTSEDLAEYSEINERECDTTHSWYSDNIISDYKKNHAELMYIFLVNNLFFIAQLYENVVSHAPWPIHKCQNKQLKI